MTWVSDCSLGAAGETEAIDQSIKTATITSVPSCVEVKRLSLAAFCFSFVSVLSAAGPVNMKT